MKMSAEISFVVVMIQITTYGDRSSSPGPDSTGKSVSQVLICLLVFSLLSQAAHLFRFGIEEANCVDIGVVLLKSCASEKI